MKNSSERKRYKTNPNFDAYLLYSYIQMKRNASDKRSRDKADKLIYEYLNNYIMYELYYSYLIKSSDNLKPFLQLFNNRSKNSLTSIGTPLKKWS